MNDDTTDSIITMDNSATKAAGSKGHRTTIDKNISTFGTSTTTTNPIANETKAAKNTLLLENLGRNARERLQKERSKRRVVQRISIDDNIEPPQNGGNNDMVPTISTRAITRNQQKSNQIHGGPNENSALVEAAAVAKKRKVTTEKIPAATSRTNQRRKRRWSIPQNNDQDSGMMIDRWVPDISHIHNDNTDHTRNENIGMQMKDGIIPSTLSNTVQLHGLPVHTTVQQIRTFFTGLQIQRILLLLPYPTQYNNDMEKFILTDYDAKYCDRNVDIRTTKAQSSKNKNNNNFCIERYDSNMVRLFVQYPSSDIATLAQQRSGEVIYVDEPRNIRSHPDMDDKRQPEEQSKQVGATIAITIVPQIAATFMTKLLGIDVHDNHVTNTNSTTLEQILEPIIERIDPQISMTLWKTVIEELSLNVNVEMQPKTRKRLLPYLQVVASNVEMQELQNEKLQLQLDIDRIIHVSASSVRHSTHSKSEDDNMSNDSYHWNKVLFFLLSTSTTNTASTYPNHYDQSIDNNNSTKFECMLNTLLHPQDRFRDPIIHLTKEYIQQLQIRIHQIDTTMAITKRKTILFGKSSDV
jgi:hypothetical protein